MLEGKIITFIVLSVDQFGRIIRRARSQGTQSRINLGNGQQIALLDLPGGRFQMGSAPGLGYKDEEPLHEVLVRPFLIGRYPVTQAQWTAVMPDDKPCRFCGPQQPLHNVSWLEAVEFCRRLSQRTGLQMRLPSEAEWEYACRAGTGTPFATGPTITTDLANYNGEFPFGQGPKGPYRHVTLDVGSFLPNPFGLHDMHGNLWEWCADPWHSNYAGAPEDGRIWAAGGSEQTRVVRGGSWHETADLCRSAVRLHLPYDEGDEMIGFRVAVDTAGA